MAPHRRRTPLHWWPVRGKCALSDADSNQAEADLADADEEAVVEESIREWFVLKGVPQFIPHYRPRDLLPFAAPLLALALSFELAALPWLVVDHTNPDPDLELPLNVAAVVAALVLLFPTLPLFRALAGPLLGRREPRAAEGRGTARNAHPRDVRRGGGLIMDTVARLAPLAGILFWLLHADLVPAELGWQGVVDIALIWLLLLAALMLALPRSRQRSDQSVTVAVLAVALMLAFANPRVTTAYPRQGVIGLVALVLLVYASWRLRPTQRCAQSVSEDSHVLPFGIVGAILVFTFEAGVAPWLSWHPAVHQAIVLALAGLVALTALRPSSRHHTRIVALSRKHRTAAGLLAALSFIGLPALLALAIESARSPASTAISMLIANTLTLVVLFGFASFGMDHVGDWMWREFWRQLRRTFTYFWSIGASVLLAVVFFTFFTNELWQVAKSAESARFWGLAAAFPVVGLALLVLRMKAEIAGHSTFDFWKDIKKCGGDEPAPKLLMARGLPPAGEAVRDIPDVKPLGWLNLALVLLVKQVLRTLLVGGLVCGVLLVVGWTVITADVLVSWGVLTTGEKDMRDMLLVEVSIFLGAFSSFFFVVNALKDAAARAQSFNDVADDIRRRLAVRAAYLTRFPPDAQRDSEAPGLAMRMLRRHLE